MTPPALALAPKFPRADFCAAMQLAPKFPPAGRTKKAIQKTIGKCTARAVSLLFCPSAYVKAPNPLFLKGKTYQAGPGLGGGQGGPALTAHRCSRGGAEMGEGGRFINCWMGLYIHIYT